MTKAQQSLFNLRKDDFVLPKRIKGDQVGVGDFVVIIDGSYTLTIPCKSTEMYHGSIGLSKDVWRIVSMYEFVPTDNLHVPDKTKTFLEYASIQNNIIITNSQGDITFCSGLNLCPIRHDSRNNRQIILKKELKSTFEDFQEELHLSFEETETAIEELSFEDKLAMED